VIIVTGSIVSRPEGLEQLLALCLEHVRRSRTEPGCRSHAVHVDAEKPLRLFFFEEWEDRESLTKHFQVPASREFVRAARALAVDATPINVYEASPMNFTSRA
jgi:quinol monooxygenase YgiN